MTAATIATDASPVSCRSCGVPGAALIGTKRGTFLNRDFEFWRCSACDYVFVRPFPGYGVYDQAYYEGRGPDPYVDYESEYADYRATDRLLEFDDLWRVASQLLSATPVEGPLEWLDFGCGAGGLLSFLRDKGELRLGARSRPLVLSGHDVGTYADRLARERGFRILSQEQLASEPDGRYDVISLVEVIEHVEYPDPVFGLVSRLLKPGGILVLTTGNIASAVARRKGLSYAYMLPEIHVGYFTPRGLAMAYARHGLSPVRVRYDGAVRFKVIKTLLTPGRKRLARAALRLPLVVRMIDGLFGTSRMPCATKPL